MKFVEGSIVDGRVVVLLPERPRQAPGIGGDARARTAATKAAAAKSQQGALLAAAKRGAPFCEECEAARRAMAAAGAA